MASHVTLWSRNSSSSRKRKTVLQPEYIRLYTCWLISHLIYLKRETFQMVLCFYLPIPTPNRWQVKVDMGEGEREGIDSYFSSSSISTLTSQGLDEEEYEDKDEPWKPFTKASLSPSVVAIPSTSGTHLLKVMTARTMIMMPQRGLPRLVFNPSQWEGNVSLLYTDFFCE